MRRSADGSPIVRTTSPSQRSAPAGGPRFVPPAPTAAAVAGDDLVSVARWKLGEYSTKSAWESTADVSPDVRCGPGGGCWLTALWIKFHSTFPTGPAPTDPTISIWDVSSTTETPVAGENGRLIMSSKVEAGKFFFFEPPVMLTEEEDVPLGGNRIVRRIYQLRLNIRSGLRIVLSDPTVADMSNLMHVTARWWYC